jgi:hypothetical protein
MEGEVRFTSAPHRVYVRVTSPTAVSGLEFHGHLGEQAAHGERLLVKHAWREGQSARSMEVPADETAYVIRCGADPRDHTIEMRSPSLPSAP